MKITIRALVALLYLSLISSTAFSTLQDEFAKINEQRTSRSNLIELLKKDNLAKESVHGTLTIGASASENVIKALREENEDRLRQFKIIASAQGTTAAEVAAAYAAKMGVDMKRLNSKTVLRLHGSSSVGGVLAPELIAGFLTSQGCTDILVDYEDEEAILSYKERGKNEVKQIEFKIYGSSSAFRETSKVSKVGLAGGFCDLGMSSRPIKSSEVAELKKLGLGDLTSPSCEFSVALDAVAIIVNRRNSVSKLTLTQIAGIFSGKINNWSELGGQNMPIRRYIRKNHTSSGTWSVFESKILKPYKYSLDESSATKLESDKKLIRKVGIEQGSISFCSISKINSRVKGIAVQAAKGLTALEPNRLTIKAESYPLSRQLYMYLPITASEMAVDFIEYTMSPKGQAIVDEIGLVGQGTSSSEDRNLADNEKKQLLSDPSIPKAYKELIKPADREDTEFNIHFNNAGTQPNTNSINNINRLVNLLSKAKNSNAQVVLIGFTSDVGGDAQNLSLSKQRAQSVADILKSKGLNKVIVDGFGEEMPVGDNNSSLGREKNRRVEVWLKR